MSPKRTVTFIGSGMAALAVWSTLTSLTIRPNDLGWSLVFVTELSRTSGLNRYSALQSTPPPQPSTTPPQNPDYDSRRTLGRYSTTPALDWSSWLLTSCLMSQISSCTVRSRLADLSAPSRLLPNSRSSTGRERSDKPLISAAPSSRPGPFIRGGSSKELLESQNPEEPRRDREREGAEPRRPSVSEDKTETERSRVREPGENAGLNTLSTLCVFLTFQVKTSENLLLQTYVKQMIISSNALLLFSCLMCRYLCASYSFIHFHLWKSPQLPSYFTLSKNNMMNLWCLLKVSWC